MRGAEYNGKRTVNNGAEDKEIKSLNSTQDTVSTPRVKAAVAAVVEEEEVMLVEEVEVEGVVVVVVVVVEEEVSWREWY